MSLMGLCASTSVARGIPLGHVLHEKRDWPTNGAVERRRIEPDVLLPMRIALKPNDDAATNGELWAMSVSDPTSPDYGRFWSAEEVVEAFRPSNDSVKTVLEWLASHDIDGVTHTDNKQWLAFDLPASRAEEILHTQFFEHEHANGGFVASCDEYHLPEHVSLHVDLVSPGIKSSDITGRSKRSRMALRKRALDQTLSHIHKSDQADINDDTMKWILDHPDSLLRCAEGITPACIRAAYSVPPVDPQQSVSSNNYLGLFEEYDLYYQGDLDRFFTRFTDIENGTAPILDPIDGGQAPPTAPNATGWSRITGESDLDIQVSQPLIYPQNVTVYQTDDRYWSRVLYQSDIDGVNRYGFFNTFLDAIDGSYCTYSAYGETGDSYKDPEDPRYPDDRPHGYKGQLQCGVYTPPYILSTSYAAQERRFPYNYQRRQCNEYMKLALQGTTIFVASGDEGVGPCYDVDDRKIFGTWQINGCPWVTSVGATQIPPNGTISDRQVASNASYDVGDGGFSSGGGFSLIFDAPPYQQAAVEAYLAGANAPHYSYFYNGDFRGNDGVYSRNGRAYPDIAALGVNVVISQQDEFQLTGGTSASTPISAALFNRIVEERLRIGKGPLGFINPALYQNPWLLDDVIEGSSPFCGFDGFEAAVGWDPVTGLGTPNFPRLLEYFLSLP